MNPGPDLTAPVQDVCG